MGAVFILKRAIGALCHNGHNFSIMPGLTGIIRQMGNMNGLYGILHILGAASFSMPPQPLIITMYWAMLAQLVGIYAYAH